MDRAFPLDARSCLEHGRQLKITAKYPGNVEMIIASGYREIEGGTKWIGDDGWVWVTRGKIDVSNKNWVGPDARAGPHRVPFGLPGLVRPDLRTGRKLEWGAGKLVLRAATPPPKC